MNEIETDWEQDNDRYVGAAVAWIRALLAAKVANQSMAPMSSPTSSRRAWRWFGVDPQRNPAIAPPSRTSSADAAKRFIELASEAATQMRETVARVLSTGNRPPALVELSERLDLSRVEFEILLLAVTVEIDTSLASQCAAINDNHRLPYPTYALAASLYEDRDWKAHSAVDSLERLRLVEVDSQSTYLFTARLTAARRVLEFAKGSRDVDARLRRYLTPIGTAAQPSDWSARRRSEIESVTTWLCPPKSPQADYSRAIQLLGADQESRREVAACSARLLGRPVYRLNMEPFGQSLDTFEEFLALWERDSRLLDLQLLIETDGVSAGGQPHLQDWQLVTLSNAVTTPFLISSAEPLDLAVEKMVRCEVSPVLPAQQRVAWLHVLRPYELADRPRLVGELSWQFRFDQAGMREAARAASRNQQPPPPRNRDFDAFGRALWNECRIRRRPRIGGLARRIEAIARWPDLVVDDDCRGRLQRIVRHVRNRWLIYDDWGLAARQNRGLGVCALFEGDSGTGKTMAAEVIASELAVDLYRVDLSQVVSKYIGETEKHLGRLFAAFAPSGAILLFDECDGLFGKRSEVHFALDKHANQEMAYLLQEIEVYPGIIILTTNNPQSLDPALTRRLTDTITFSGLEKSLRLRQTIWERHFVAAAGAAAEGQTYPPCEALDFEKLSQLKFNGGQIQKVVQKALVRAAERGSSARVAMDDLLAAAREECTTLGRKTDEALFTVDKPRKERVA